MSAAEEYHRQGKGYKNMISLLNDHSSFKHNSGVDRFMLPSSSGSKMDKAFDGSDTKAV